MKRSRPRPVLEVTTGSKDIVARDDRREVLVDLAVAIGDEASTISDLRASDLLSLIGEVAPAPIG